MLALKPEMSLAPMLEAAASSILRTLIHNPHMLYPLALALAVSSLSPVAIGHGWQSYPIGAGFTAEFPSKPEPRKEPESRELSELLALTAWGLDGSYVSVKAKFAGGLNPQREVWEAGQVDGAVAGDFSKLVEQRESLFHGWPALEVSVKGANGIVMADYSVKINDLIIQLSCNYGGSEPRPKAVDRFLHSLQPPASLNPGPLAEIGPKFSEYKVGDSAIVASFPHKPEQDPSDPGLPAGKKELTKYSTFYVNRNYTVGYGELPAQVELTQANMTEARSYLCDDIAQMVGAKTTKKSVAPLGSEDATWGEMALPNGKVARSMIALHGHTFAVGLAFGPGIFEKEYSDFLHSIKFAK